MELINKNIDKINIIRGNYHIGHFGYEGYILIPLIIYYLLIYR